MVAAAGRDLVAAAEVEFDFAEAATEGFESELVAAADFAVAAATVAEIAAVAAEASYFPARPKAKYYSYFAVAGSVAKALLALVQKSIAAERLLVAAEDLVLRTVLVERAGAAVAEKIVPVGTAADFVLKWKLDPVDFPSLNSVLQVPAPGLDNFQGCYSRWTAGSSGPVSVLFVQGDHLGSGFAGLDPGLRLVAEAASAAEVVADLPGFDYDLLDQLDSRFVH